MRGRFLIDTNVLIYATLEADGRFAAARRVIELRLTEGNAACVSAQNLAEMYPNLTGPKTQPPDSPMKAREKINAIARLHRLTVIPVTRDVVEKALALCQACGATRQKYFDMQIAATMQLHGIGTIVTENVRDFECIDGVEAWNPFLDEAKGGE